MQMFYCDAKQPGAITNKTIWRTSDGKRERALKMDDQKKWIAFKCTQTESSSPHQYTYTVWLVFSHAEIASAASAMAVCIVGDEVTDALLHRSAFTFQLARPEPPLPPSVALPFRSLTH
jgi:hypothetical protein